jgi:hypothetical protein
VRKAPLVVALCLLIVLAFSAGRLESQTVRQKALIVAGMDSQALQADLNAGWRVAHLAGSSQQNGVGSWLVVLER